MSEIFESDKERVQVEDIIILKYFNSIIPDKNLSDVLGPWYLQQLDAGLQHEQLETYILETYLPTLGYTPENILWFKDEYEKFEMAYAQNLLAYEALQPSEAIISECQELATETPETEVVKFDMHLFLMRNLSNQWSDYITPIYEWYKTVSQADGDKYIFDTWLPSFIVPEEVVRLKELYNYQIQYGMQKKPNIIGDVVVHMEEIEKVEELSAALQPSVDVETTRVFTPEAKEVVAEQMQQLLQESIPVDIVLAEASDADLNLKGIRELQKEVDDKLTKIMLMKEPYLRGENYVNDSYKYCPSFKHLIPQVQNAIIAKREQKANEKWFEKYRPELVEEILFPNQAIKETINEYVDKKHIAGNCLFYGTGGVGKTTTNVVLMNATLENVADRFFLDRKVESVDALKGWLNKKPIGKQKIVIAEEFDRLSDAAMTELKNGLMEKYEYVVFLASTNKIHKIDEALLTRFTLISKFETAQVSDITEKCRYILTNERVQFNEEDLAFFVEQNKLRGIRTILNNLQLSCYMGVFEPKRTAFFIGDSGTEYDMVGWIKWYINYLIQLPKESLWYLSYDLNSDANIKQVRGMILETLLANYSLNYDYIFMEILKDNVFLPIKNCVNVYYQDIDSKRIKAMHFEAMLNDFINILFTTKDVYAK